MNHHSHLIRIYYEDTDLSGSVYHSNYLKYFERAREHLIGPEVLANLYQRQGLGFVVYEVSLNYRKSASLADELEIRTQPERCSDFRARFHQSAWHVDGDAPIVEGYVDIVCVDRDENLVPLPDVVDYE